MMTCLRVLEENLFGKNESFSGWKQKEKRDKTFTSLDFNQCSVGSLTKMRFDLLGRVAS
jgi:hypothetical protein